MLPQVEGLRVYLGPMSHAAANLNRFASLSSPRRALQHGFHLAQEMNRPTALIDVPAEAFLAPWGELLSMRGPGDEIANDERVRIGGSLGVLERAAWRSPTVDNDRRNVRQEASTDERQISIRDVRVL